MGERVKRRDCVGEVKRVKGRDGVGEVERVRGRKREEGAQRHSE